MFASKGGEGLTLTGGGRVRSLLAAGGGGGQRTGKGPGGQVHHDRALLRIHHQGLAGLLQKRLGNSGQERAASDDGVHRSNLKAVTSTQAINRRQIFAIALFLPNQIKPQEW